MSTEASSKGKGVRTPTSANNDADSIMPLLFATIGNPSISFKKMAAMDELGRTESSLEHKFRKWRQKGREIAAKNPEIAGTLGTPSAEAATTKKPRAPAKKGDSGKGKGPIERAGVEDEGVETGGEARPVKQEPDQKHGISGEMLHPSTEGKATATNSTKKRAASVKVAAGEQEAGEAPAKKAKVAKKGTAKVVKKSNVKMCSGSEDEEVPNQPTEKGRGSVGAASGKGKAAGAAKAGQIPIHEDEDADVDTNLEDGQHDGLIDMQFDETA